MWAPVTSEKKVVGVGGFGGSAFDLGPFLSGWAVHFETVIHPPTIASTCPTSIHHTAGCLQLGGQREGALRGDVGGLWCFFCLDLILPGV